MTNEKFNPFENSTENTSIDNENDLNEAKEMAGVVDEKEHLERMLASGDKKLIQVALEQIQTQLKEKDDSIEKLNQQVTDLEIYKKEVNKIREILDGAEKINQNDYKEANEAYGAATKMNKDEFEKQYGTNMKVVAHDYRGKVLLSNDQTDKAINTINNILISAHRDKSKKIIIVDDDIFVVDKQ